MFEVRNDEKTRAFGVKIFDQLPAIARAYIYILVLFIITLLIMGLIDAFAPRPTFGAVIERLLSFMGLIVGSVIGALSAGLKTDSSSKPKL